MKGRTKLFLLDAAIVAITLLQVALAAYLLLAGYRICGAPGLSMAALYVGAHFADAVTPLGLLNFCVLQWFGVRLCKRYERVAVDDGSHEIHGVSGAEWLGVPPYLSLASRVRTEQRLVGYGVRRWIWPLTGWWSDFRWIARRT